jgi:transposase
MRALGMTAQRVLAARREAKQLEAELCQLVTVMAPALLGQPGIGPISAAQVLISWSHPGRFRSEAAFAMLAGAVPVEVSLGQVVRLASPWWGPAAESGLAHHRDAPPGPSRADQGLHQPPHRPGKSEREIGRCLKRSLARQVYRLLERTATNQPAVDAN